MDREFVIMLMVILKILLRCNDKDAIKRTRDTFLREDIRSKVKNTKITMSGKANKLLYFTAKHPNFFTVSFAKAVIAAFDKKTN